MASAYLRYFESPTEIESGTILTMSLSATRAIEDPNVVTYMLSEGITVEELEKEQYVCFGDRDEPMAWREVVLRPPLNDEQKLILGHLAASSFDHGHNNINVVDCTQPNSTPYSPIIVQC